MLLSGTTSLSFQKKPRVTWLLNKALQLCLKWVPSIGLSSGGMSPLMNKGEPGRDAEHGISNYLYCLRGLLIPWLVLIFPLAFSEKTAESEIAHFRNCSQIHLFLTYTVLKQYQSRLCAMTPSTHAHNIPSKYP